MPDNWGHALINYEPCIGVSKQVGEFKWNDGIPDSVLTMLA